jgi:alanine-glyoxylate transaminase/serine-glyoxylate transaminase/serine-pyruvate transaminase
MSEPSPIPPALDPSARLLCGAGPTNVDAGALAALQRPLLGHMDPDMLEILDQVVELLRRTWQAPGATVFALSCTGTAGMEAGIANLVEPGDTIVVGVAGYFASRIAEIGRRYGANVVEVQADWGQVVPVERLMHALEQHPKARLVAVVQGETSTGALYPLRELGEALRGRDTLLMADCVTSLGGVELDFDGWGLDYAYSCTQKCIGAPPGMSPIALSERALQRITKRTHPTSFLLDLQLLSAYWIKRPAAYHHTAPILHIYALHEALRGVLTEGLPERWSRHAAAASQLRDGLAERGLETLADPAHALAGVTGILVPAGVDRAAVQGHLLREHAIEISGGLGAPGPDIWRIGLMGPNASADTVVRLLQALDSALAA